MLTCLCISLGMFNHLGLTVSSHKVINVFDKGAVKPQNVQLYLDELFLESDDKKASDFNKVVDAYLLQVLDNALNKMPPREKKLQDITESELKSFLHKTTSTACPSKYNITLPDSVNV